MFTLTADKARKIATENLERKNTTQKDMILKRIDSAINHAVSLGLFYTSYQIFTNEYNEFGEDIEVMLDLAGYQYTKRGSLDDGIITYLISWEDKPIIPIKEGNSYVNESKGNRLYIIRATEHGFDCEFTTENSEYWEYKDISKESVFNIIKQFDLTLRR